jgi:hypothetical protein
MAGVPLRDAVVGFHRPAVRPQPGQITPDTAELDRLNDIWHDVGTVTGRRSLGAPVDGTQMVMELANYSAYPIENVAVQVLEAFKHAQLITPEGVQKDPGVYVTEEGGTGGDIERVSACARVRLN